MPHHDPADQEPAGRAQVRGLRSLTLQQVADELATMPVTIRALIRGGELPAIQIGGRGQWCVERVKLEEYVTAAYTRARTDISRGTLSDENTISDEDTHI